MMNGTLSRSLIIFSACRPFQYGVTIHLIAVLDYISLHTIKEKNIPFLTFKFLW